MRGTGRLLHARRCRQDTAHERPLRVPALQPDPVAAEVLRRHAAAQLGDQRHADPAEVECEGGIGHPRVGGQGVQFVPEHALGDREHGQHVLEGDALVGRGDADLDEFADLGPGRGAQVAEEGQRLLDDAPHHDLDDVEEGARRVAERRDGPGHLTNDQFGQRDQARTQVRALAAAVQPSRERPVGRGCDGHLTPRRVVITFL